MTDVERAGNLFIRHAPLQFENRGRGCEGSDAESIEEVGDETGREVRQAHGAQRTATTLEEPPAPEERHADAGHDPEQYVHPIHGGHRWSRSVAATKIKRVPGTCGGGSPPTPGHSADRNVAARRALESDPVSVQSRVKNDTGHAPRHR